MSEADAKAPPGTFVVYEVLHVSNEWTPMGKPYDTLTVAQQVARELNAPYQPALTYCVCDQNGPITTDAPRGYTNAD